MRAQLLTNFLCFLSTNLLILQQFYYLYEETQRNDSINMSILVADLSPHDSSLIAHRLVADALVLSTCLSSHTLKHLQNIYQQQKEIKNLSFVKIYSQVNYHQKSRNKAEFLKKKMLPCCGGKPPVPILSKWDLSACKTFTGIRTVAHPKTKVIIS